MQELTSDFTPNEISEDNSEDISEVSVEISEVSSEEISEEISENDSEDSVVEYEYSVLYDDSLVVQRLDSINQNIGVTNSLLIFVCISILIFIVSRFINMFFQNI